LVSGPIVFTLAESGHIAGVINPPAAHARGYWSEECQVRDPEEWLHQCATKHTGSWWTDWVTWLHKYSPRQVTPPSMGNREFPPLADAPGTYVFET
jgi:polyhydroxyalkanoate synthase subunit PhaC